MTQNITRRSFAGLSLAAVGALALTACNSQSENKGSSASGSGDAKKVRIGVEGAYPPFSEIGPDGKLKGFALHVVDATGQRVG